MPLHPPGTPAVVRTPPSLGEALAVAAGLKTPSDFTAPLPVTPDKALAVAAEARELSGKAPLPVTPDQFLARWKGRVPVSQEGVEALQARLNQRAVPATPVGWDLMARLRRSKNVSDQRFVAAMKLRLGATRTGVETAEKRGRYESKIFEQMAKDAELSAEYRTSIRGIKKRGLAKAEKGLDAAKRYRRYFKATPERIDELQEISKDAGRTKEERDAADRELAKAETLEPDIGIGQRILAGLAAGFTAMAHIRMGLKPPVITAIDKLIDQDIARQRAKREERRRGVTDVRDEFLTVERQFETLGEQELAVKVQKWEAAQLQLKQISATMMSPEAQARAQELNAAMATEGAQVRARLDQASVAQEIRLFGMQQKAAARPAGRPIPGLKQIAPTGAAESKRARQIYEAYGIAKANLAKLIPLRKDIGFIEIWDRKKVADAKRWATAVRDAIRRFKGYGARFERGEEEMMNSYIQKDPSEAGVAIYEKLVGLDQMFDDEGYIRLRVQGYALEGMVEEGPAQ